MFDGADAMKIYDATFSTNDPGGLKPGETIATWKVGLTVLPECEPVEWSGSAWGLALTEKDYTPERIASWRQRVQSKPGQLGICDIEHLAEKGSDASLKRIFTACAAGGLRVGTFGGCWGTHRLKMRDGYKFNTLIGQFYEQNLWVDEAILHRLDTLAPVLAPLEYLTVEVQNDQPRFFEMYLKHHARWSQFYEVRFPKKKRLSWFSPCWTHHPQTGEGGYWPMTTAELAAWFDAFRAAGNDVLIWGPWYAVKSFFDTGESK